MTGFLGAIFWLLAQSAMGELYRPPPDEVNKVADAIKRAKAVMLEKKNTPFGDLMKDKRKFEEDMGLCCTGKKKDTPYPIMSDAGYEALSSIDKQRFRLANGHTFLEVAERVTKLNEDDAAEYTRILNKFQSAQAESRRLHQEAIELAAKIYHIAPPEPEGVIQSGPPAHLRPDGSPDPDYVPSHLGQTAQWRPTYREGMEKGQWGKTGHDGRVLIGPDAFEHPGRLAFALHHESRHFDRLLIPDLDLRNVPGEEVALREREHPDGLRYFFNFTEAEVAEHEAKLLRERRYAEGWSTLIAQGRDPYKKSHLDAFPADYRPLGPEEKKPEALAEILRQAQELRAKMEAERRARTSGSCGAKPGKPNRSESRSWRISPAPSASWPSPNATNSSPCPTVPFTATTRPPG